jgi:hypothetical protein
LKAILKYPLYRRPHPTNEITAIGFLDEGTVLVTEKVVAGKEIDGISIWFHAEDGFFYWGGGMKVMPGEPFVSWNTLPPETQLAVLSSVVNDEAYWIEKKVIGSLGYGMGYKNDDMAAGLALTIFVDAKTPSGNLEKTTSYNGIQDIPIDVKAVEKIEHQEYDPRGIKDLQPDKGSPMQMGGSISLDNSEDYGTRSLVLIDKNNKPFLMTCFHVLLNGFKQKGIFPFPGSNTIIANYPNDKRNSTGKKIRKETVVAGRYAGKYDFALISLSNHTDLMNAFDNRRFNGFHTSDTLPALLHKEVVMAGTTSIMQKGKVLDTKATIFVGAAQIRFENVVVTEKISMPGDSGAPVLDLENMIVGIIIAGNQEDRSYVLPIHNIIFQQGYSLAL